MLEFENWDWASDEEPILDENQEEDNSESPVSVPESTSALGLLALGVWGIMKAMKIRLEK
ncbi:PEP-CTERM sorting domain-containing protein [Nostoc sp.]|uniref:PEP-CTERM sorting domain-containing protein n=1 Tax=Nostoc sp. TaxID=1180 RepID=UPI002FFB0C82